MGRPESLKQFICQSHQTLHHIVDQQTIKVLVGLYRLHVEDLAERVLSKLLQPENAHRVGEQNGQSRQA